MVAPQGSGSMSNTEQLLAGVSFSKPSFVLYPPPVVPSLPFETCLVKCQHLLQEVSDYCSRGKQTVNSVPGPYLLKSGHFTSPCLSFLIYVKFRFLIFVKFRFLGSIPRESPLAGLGAGISFSSSALWRSLMLRTCGLHSGKS